MHRSAIDLPTTGPNFDYYGTSDYDDYDENRLNTAKSMAKVSIKINSNYEQRPRTSEKEMPNELIIRSKKSETNADDDSSGTKTDSDAQQICFSKFSNLMVSELPAIKGSKRHITWQNMKR